MPLRIMWRNVTLIIILISLLTGCEETSNVSKSPAYTYTQVAPTHTPVPPTLAPPTETPSTELSRADSLHYASVSKQKTNLDVVFPADPGSYPIVIMIHGKAVARERYQPLADSIASKGFVVYNISVVHSNPFSQSIHRIVCALHFAAATADEYHGDPNRIILVGHSAGAATGAVAALSGDDFGEECVIDNQTGSVSALIGYEGNYDFAFADYINNEPSLSDADHNHLKESDPELYASLNVYNHIGRYPEIRFRLMHGTYEDDIIEVEVSEDFLSALVKAGYDAEMVLIENATHMDVMFPEKDAFSALLELVTEELQ